MKDRKFCHHLLHDLFSRILTSFLSDVYLYITFDFNRVHIREAGYPD
jgi:hypothetical protein